MDSKSAAQNEPPQNTAKPRQLRLRFSLRTALIAMLLTALGASYLVRPTKEYRQETALRKRINDLGGEVTVANTDSHGLGHGAAIIRRLGGGKFVQQLGERITSVQLSGKQVTQDDIDAITHCSHLKSLQLRDAGLTDEMLQAFSICSELLYLQISSNDKITDAGAQSLAKLNLKSLDIVGTRISNEFYHDLELGYHGLQDIADQAVLQRVEAELRLGGYLNRDRSNSSLHVDLTQATDEQIQRDLESFRTLCTYRNAIQSRYVSFELLDRQFNDDLLAKLNASDAPSPILNQLILQCVTQDDKLLSRAARLNIETLELAGENVPRDFVLLQESRNLEEISLPDVTDIAASDFAAFATIGGLKTLRIPQSHLSEESLSALLLDPPMNLEKLELPDHLSHLRFKILDSKLAKMVNFPSDSLAAEIWDERFTEALHKNSLVNISTLINDVKVKEPGYHALSYFLTPTGPNDEANSFSDFMVLTQIENGIQSRQYTRLLSTVARRLPLTNTPIEELAASPEAWRSVVNNQPASAFLLTKMWSALATTHISEGEMSKALDLGVRTLALWPTMELYEDQLLEPIFAGDLDVAYQAFADLCHLTHDTDETRKLKKLIFMIPEENEVTWEQPAKLIGPWDRIGILAPVDRELAQVKSDHERLDIVIDGKTQLRGKQQFALPAGTKQIFVTPESFPLTIATRQ